MQHDSNSGGVSRRALIATSLVPVTVLSSAAQAPAAALTPAQRQTLGAFIDRLIPSDEDGPGALESGVADYIDRSLADALAAEKPAFFAGLAAVEAYTRRTSGRNFTDLPADGKDAILTAMENNSATGFEPDSRTFFLRVRQLTLEGMFGDPFYGGNRAFAGWDLVRYPGPRLAAGPDDQKMDKAPKPLRASAYGSSHGH
jgi:gluconate 2-dehydrogenase gamma chain